MEVIPNGTNSGNIGKSLIINKNLTSLSAKTYIEKGIEISKYKICLASFPRSGNTMLRTIFENITETFTGDDMIIEFPTETNSLGKMGLGEEGIVDDKVYFVKTHYPFSYFPKNEFCAEGAVLIVRNPFDAFESLYAFSQTDSHCKTLSEDEFKEKYNHWESFLNSCIGWYKHFYEYWLGPKKIPIFMRRYEDFAQEKEKYSIELFNFIDSFQPDKSYLGDLTIKDINIKIKESTAIKNNIAYIPRIGSNYHTLINNRYTEKQLEKIFDELWEILIYFGYLENIQNLEIDLINKVIAKVISIKEVRKIESELNNSPNLKYLNSNNFSLNNRDFVKNSEDKESKEVLVINDKENIILKSHFDEMEEYWIK